MFFFGAPEDTAVLMISGVMASSGPGAPDKPLTEGNKEEVRNIMVYRSAALRRSIIEGADEKVIEILTDMYEEALIEFCRYSDAVLVAMEAGEHLFPNNEFAARERQKVYVARACERRQSEN